MDPHDAQWDPTYHPMGPHLRPHLRPHGTPLAAGGSLEEGGSFDSRVQAQIDLYLVNNGKEEWIGAKSRYGKRKREE